MADRLEGARRLREYERETQLTPAQAAELPQVLDQVEAANAKRNRAWAAATREQLEALIPSDEPCPATVEAPSEVESRRFREVGLVGRNEFHLRLIQLRKGEPLPRCEDCEHLAAEISADRGRLAAGTANRFTLEFMREKLSPRPVVVLLVDEETAPYARGDSFDAGSIEGRAYYWDGQEFPCAGSVQARNSGMLWGQEKRKAGGGTDEIESERAANEALARDLELNLRSTIPGGMRAVKTAARDAGNDPARRR